MDRMAERELFAARLREAMECQGLKQAGVIQAASQLGAKLGKAR